MTKRNFPTTIADTEPIQVIDDTQPADGVHPATAIVALIFGAGVLTSAVLLIFGW